MRIGIHEPSLVASTLIATLKPAKIVDLTGFGCTFASEDEMSELRVAIIAGGRTPFVKATQDGPGHDPEPPATQETDPH